MTRRASTALEVAINVTTLLVICSIRLLGRMSLMAKC